MKHDLLYPLRRIHGFIHEYPEYRKNRMEVRKNLLPQIREQLRMNPDAVFLVMTPEHRNLGDHAIAAAEASLLKSLGIRYIEIPDTQLNKLYRAGLLSVMNGHPIIINGGGNMGTLWFGAELTHRAVIKNNPRSEIFIFPNTIYYEDSEWGREELRKSVKCYNRHRYLHLYAREETSFSVMREIYRDVKLVPDIVFLLNESDRRNERKGCLLCLRKDLESTRTPEIDQTIMAQAQRLFGTEISATDTVADAFISAGQRTEALERKYEEFSRASLVITDRLHGMILCAITGTPCIVLNSRSPKVLGCYKWIENLDYIRFVDTPDQIANVYQEIPMEPHNYDNANMMEYFQALADDIVRYTGKGNRL